MIEIPLVTIEEIAYRLGDGTQSLSELAFEVVKNLRTREIGGVIAATFSNPERFPALSVRIASALGLPAATPAFDIQMACSAYPYAVYLAGRLSADTGRRILVVNGDVQSPLVNADDHATGRIFSDAVTASIVFADRNGVGKSPFDFLSRADEALGCPSSGPIFMDGMKVFTFVATEVRAFLKSFLANLQSPASTPQPPITDRQPPTADRFELFVPHQANPYMIRQLAKSLELEKELVTLDESIKNPGSCSIPLALAKGGRTGRALLAGFGAGYSASVGIVDVKYGIMR